MTPFTTRSIFTIIAFLVSMTMFSQETTVHGSVFDQETKLPISNVNIYVVGEKRGTVTDIDGLFNLSIKRARTSIIVSHIGYVIVQHKIVDASLPLKITLRKEEIALKEISISGKRIEVLSNPDSLYIVDYVIQNNGQIIAYGVVHKNPRKERLWLFSETGDLLYTKEVEKAGRSFLPESEKKKTRQHYLFKDCYGETHFFSKNEIWQLYVKDDVIKFLYPADFNVFFSLVFPVRVRVGDMILYRNPEPPVSNIVRINPLPDKQKPKFISWKKAERVKRSPDPPIFNHNDSIVLFNFLGNAIEFYSPTGEYVKNTSIDFHLETYYDLFIFKTRGISKDCKKVVLCDQKRKKYYVLFKKSVLYYLYEVDIHTGEVKDIIKIPDYPNIENIQIRNGIIYFLYTEKKYPNNRSLYRFIPQYGRTVTK